MIMNEQKRQKKQEQMKITRGTISITRKILLEY
jgi:hypothetical protein